MLVAYRNVFATNERASTYLPLYHTTNTSEATRLHFREDASQVDGIGGILWEGALLLNHVLARLSLGDRRVLELGCGTGICGLFAATCGAHAILTDREVDLVSNNARCNPSSLDIEVSPVTWSTDTSSLPHFDAVDIVIGAEIAVLNKQHALLVATLRHYTSSHTLLLLSFDGPPPPHHCTYAQHFLFYMTEQHHYHYEVVAHGHVTWREGLPDGVREEEEEEHILRSEQAILTLTASPSNQRSSYDTCSEHHVLGFYLPSAARTCSQCHRHFHPLLNHSSACRYHTGLFVCRYHPAEANCSIDGLGDSLGYYCRGEERWDAKFWDCCGSEDPEALGCSHGEHVPYS